MECLPEFLQKRDCCVTWKTAWHKGRAAASKEWDLSLQWKIITLAKNCQKFLVSDNIITKKEKKTYIYQLHRVQQYRRMESAILKLVNFREPKLKEMGFPATISVLEMHYFKLFWGLNLRQRVLILPPQDSSNGNNCMFITTVYHQYWGKHYSSPSLVSN